MKALPLVFLLLSLALAQAQFRDGQVINDIGDGEVAAIASRLKLRYKELGMGNNQLGSGTHVFSVSVPDAGNEWGPTPMAERRKQTLSLVYSSSRKGFAPKTIQEWNSVWSRHFSTAESDPGGSSLTAKLFLVDGVTFRTVLEHVRRFSQEIKEFEAGSSTTKP